MKKWKSSRKSQDELEGIRKIAREVAAKTRAARESGAVTALCDHYDKIREDEIMRDHYFEETIESYSDKCRSRNE